MSTLEQARKLVLDSMAPLFARADREGLWFYSRYHGLWFSPAELRKEHAKGACMWGAVNWELRDPQECAIEAERHVVDSRIALLSIQNRIAAARSANADQSQPVENSEKSANISEKESQ